MLPTMELGGSRSFKMLTNIKFEKVWPHLTKKKKMWKKSVEMGWQSNANQSRGSRRNVELHTIILQEIVVCGGWVAESMCFVETSQPGNVHWLYSTFNDIKRRNLKNSKKKMRENVKNITKCVCLRETSPHIFWTWYFDYVPKTKDKNSMHILNDN